MKKFSTLNAFGLLFLLMLPINAVAAGTVTLKIINLAPYTLQFTSVDKQKIKVIGNSVVPLDGKVTLQFTPCPKTKATRKECVPSAVVKVKSLNAKGKTVVDAKLVLSKKGSLHGYAIEESNNTICVSTKYGGATGGTFGKKSTISLISPCR